MIGVVYLPVLYTMFRSYFGGGVCTSEARMDDKTVLITGANTGIGKETAIDLARRGARVIMACRDMKRGQDALNEVAEKTGSSKLVLKQLDLASLASVIGRRYQQDGAQITCFDQQRWSNGSI